MPINNNIDNKIKSILEAIKDEDTMDLSKDVSDPSIVRDYSGMLEDASDNQEIAIGSTLGHWTVKELIGKGGMSIVYLAERNDEQLKQQVALKVIPQGLASKTLVDRFIRERQILSDLNHQNIAKLYDVGVTDTGVPWFVMELIQGENILNYAKTHELNVEQKIILFKQVCDALAYAHSQGIVHRDIKPGNLMVTDDKVVKLLDFGIASDDEQRSLTMTGAIMGTPGYMSPEQAKGLNDKIDRRSDIFSAGVLLYKLIKDDMPFKADSISEISYKIIHDEPTLIGNDIPADIQAIVFKCLEKKLENRYSSFKNLLNDLDAYLAGDVVRARKITWTGRCIKKIKKHPLLSVVLFLALIATFSGIAYGIYESIDSIRKVQLTKEYMTSAEQIKNKIRRTHMMPLHNVQEEYKQYEAKIEVLRKAIEKDGIDDTGLSEFALGTAYQNMRNFDKAWQYFGKSEQKGWKSAELYSGLGQANALEWNGMKNQSKRIADAQEREKFLTHAKNKFYYPALEYLSKAQKGSIDPYFLKAQLAYIEGDFELTIENTSKEIQLNPWHYEALKLESSAYRSIFQKEGSKNGYDSAVKYLIMSNDSIEKAIEIGKSDPSNYLNRCTNAGISMQIQRYTNYAQIDNFYEKGIKYCQQALVLDPDVYSPWGNLYYLHKTKAEQLESIEQPAIELYKLALSVIEQGLVRHPENMILLLSQAKPLYILAAQAIEFKQDPMPFYMQALVAIDKAALIDVDSDKPHFERARLNSAISEYYITVKQDLVKAEEFVLNSIQSSIKVDEIRNNYVSKLNINYYKFDLAEIKYAQGEKLESIELIKQSISGRLAALPPRVSYFNLYIHVLQAQINLLEKIVELELPTDDEKLKGLNSIQLVCSFEKLSAENIQQLDEIIKIYVDNNWLKKDNFSNCH